MLLSIVDAFTSSPFHGNPAAVCLLGDEERSDEWMQSVAAEMNLSETAFVRLIDDGGNAGSRNRFNIRWMTPTNEVDLCGHATLAAAHILFREGIADPSMPITFSSRSGPLAAHGVGEQVQLDFPAKPAEPVTDIPDALRKAIPLEILHVAKNDFDYLVEIGSDEALRALTPDFTLLKTLGVRGVVVTAIPVAHADYDIISRGFFPGVGIDEDPVTGSAHCMLAPYWRERLFATARRDFHGNLTFRAYQASKRGGFIDLTMRGNRVLLAGNAVTITRGELLA